MSDGWNHAGRTVKTGEPGYRGCVGRALDHQCPTRFRGTDLGQNIRCRRVGSSGWKFLLLWGWTTEKTKKPGTQREWGQMWVDRYGAHVWGQGRQREHV